jgi:hypothetical protein
MEAEQNTIQKRGLIPCGEAVCARVMHNLLSTRA